MRTTKRKVQIEVTLVEDSGQLFVKLDPRALGKDGYVPVNAQFFGQDHVVLTFHGFMDPSKPDSDE